MAERKKRGCGFYLLCFFGLGLAAQLAVIVANPKILTSRPPPEPMATTDPAVLDDQVRLHSAVLAAKSIQQAVNDPDSLVIESARTTLDGQIVCVNYRARNGFGGMVRSTAAFDAGTPNQTDKFWNAHCTGPLIDMTVRVNRRL